MNLGRWSPNVPWARWQWWAARAVLVVLAGLAMAVSLWAGLPWVGLVVVAFAAAWIGPSFWAERLEHGPRRRGGEPR